MEILQALHERLVCQPLNLQESEKVSQGGIIIVDQSPSPQAFPARVISVGEGKMLNDGLIVQNKIKVDDVVFMNKNMAVQFKYKNELYYAVKEGDILALIETVPDKESDIAVELVSKASNEPLTEAENNYIGASISHLNNINVRSELQTIID